MTVHRVDAGSVMRSSLLDFFRFKTPHTGKSSCNVLPEIMKERSVERMVQSITTENIADMIKGIELLRRELCTSICLGQ